MPTPAQMRDRYRAIAYRYRSLPGKHGLRTHTVRLVNADWTGDYTGEGQESQRAIDLVEQGGLPPKVRWLKDEEIAVGGLAAGTVVVGPITPDFSGGGTAFSELSVDLSIIRGNTFHLFITGPQHPQGARYRVTSTGGDKALHYTITAEPIANEP